MKKFKKLLIKTCLIVTLLLPSFAGAADTYIVQKGDSLWKIAVRYQIGLSEIIGSNPQFKDPHWIYPGDKVYVPNIDQVKSIEQQVIDLTNQERQKRGLNPLHLDWEVARVARYKSTEMRDKNYFAHESPTYGSPFQMLTAFDVNYRGAGENIAAGQTTPQEVVNSWMNSEGHRRNILDPNFTHIGVGYATGGSYGFYWTQMFITK
jgi:uncharacterized YkwD family protein/spore coat assembly protein SafA